MSEPKFDAERVLDALRDIFEAQLPAKITEIQTEKDALLGDANFQLENIPANSFFDSLDDRVANKKIYVYYGLGNHSVIQNEEAEGEDLTVFFYVIYDQQSDSTSAYKKGLRYIRALKEIMEENANEFSEMSSFELQSVLPVDIRDLDNGGETTHKAAGINLTTAIG